MIRRRIVIFACAALFGACTDSVGPTIVEPLTGLLVSNPISTGAVATGGTVGASRSPASPAAADSIVYVSLTPGTVPSGTDATIRRLGGSDALTTHILDGGFDPLAIGAQVGDTILIRVTGTGGVTLFQTKTVVAATRQPVVVRTDPPPRKRDVPLNTAIVVVFSEPVAGTSLNAASVQLRAGQSAVSGTVRFIDATLDPTHVTAEFVPDAPLSANTEYTLIVTQQVRDLDGDALAARDTATFTTGNISTGAPASVEISPADSGLRAGTSRQLRATVRDADGNTLTDRAVTWSSSDPSTVSVSSTGLLTAVAPGGAFITASVSPSVRTVVHINSFPGPATSVTIVPAAASVAAGDTVFLTAIAHDARGFLTGVIWSSGSTSIATVNYLGMVIGVSQGSATITAAGDSAKDTAVVTVTPQVPVASVSVTPDVDTLVVLDVPTLRLTATVRDSSDRLIGRQVTWTSDNTAVASVDANGLVSAAGPGKAMIAATSQGVSGHADVTVLPTPPVASVTIAPESATVRVQDRVHVGLRAILRDSAGRTIVRPITWVSDNAAIATVDANGLVTAVSLGIATITATSEAVSGSAVITVLPPAPVARVWILRNDVPTELVIQDTLRLAVMVVDSEGSIVTGRLVSWASDDQTVATVDAQGLVTALTPGQASVTATSEGSSDTLAFTVIVVNFASVSAGGRFTCALETSGAVSCWGAQDVGQLGNGKYATGANRAAPSRVAGGLEFTAVTTGFDHACGIAIGGAAYCWGAATYGGSSTPVPVGTNLPFTALSAGNLYTCGVATSGAAYCWGGDSLGRLGNGFGSSPYPALVTGGLTFTAISAGLSHTCGLVSSGAAYCWGDNQFLQIGNGSINPGPFPPTLVSGGFTFTAIAVGNTHTCALSTGGTVYCWGSASVGQLGNSSTISSAVPRPVFGGTSYTSVTSGGKVSCGIASSGRADCWGLNQFGQLGTGTFTGPQQCSGSPCSTTPVSVLGNLTFSQVTVGDSHTCGRTSSGEVYCWGSNQRGQLGNGTTTDSNVPVKVLGQP